MALTAADFPVLVAAGLMAALAAIVPRLLSGPVERPDPAAIFLSGAAHLR
jgi:hypothetical protein